MSNNHELGSSQPTDSNKPEERAERFINPEEAVDYDSFIEMMMRSRPNSRESLWETFLTREHIGPYEHELAQLFAKINNMIFLDPLDRYPDKNRIKRYIDLHLIRLKMAKMPVRFIPDFLNIPSGTEREMLYDIYSSDAGDRLHMNAFNTASNIVLDAENSRWFQRRDEIFEDTRAMAEKYERTHAWTEVQTLASKITNEPSSQLARYDVLQAAAWIVVQDRMSERQYSQYNPFLPLIDLYEQGYWPLGTVEAGKIKKHDEFAVYVPPYKTTY